MLQCLLQACIFSGKELRYFKLPQVNVDNRDLMLMTKTVPPKFQAYHQYISSWTLISYKSTNMRRYLSFNTSFKDIRESPSTNNHDASTPRFPNLMVCNYQSHSRMKIKEKFSNVHWKHLASLYQT